MIRVNNNNQKREDDYTFPRTPQHSKIILWIKTRSIPNLLFLQDFKVVVNNKFLENSLQIWTFERS